MLQRPVRRLGEEDFQVSKTAPVGVANIGLSHDDVGRREMPAKLAQMIRAEAVGTG